MSSALQFFENGKLMSPVQLVAKLQAKDHSGDIKTAQENASIAFLQDCLLEGLTPAAMLARHVDFKHADLTNMYGSGIASQIDNGISATFAAAQMPLHRKTEIDAAILAANSDVFTTGGLRVLLPLLMDNLVREVENTIQVERVEDFVAVTRQVAGNQLITEITYDKASGDAYDSFRIAEGGRIPVRTVKATRSTAEFYKVGSGIEFTYEAGRRITPDMMIPMVNRQRFERTQAEARLAVYTLLNGDGHNGAAPVEQLQTYDGTATGAITGRARGLMKFLMNCARNNRPVDTLVVNWETAFDLMTMFPINNAQNVAAQSVMQIGSQFGMGISFQGFPSLGVHVLISNAIPDRSILVYRRGETLDRLLEIGSQISEMERSIRTQSIVMTNTINTGFMMNYHESRRLLTWAV